MGASCSSCFKKKHHKKIKNDSTAGSSELEEVLTFKVEISNIKGRNLPATSSYLKIKFGDQKVFETPEITSNPSNYSWRFSQEFDYKTTRASLKDDSIMLVLMDKMGREIGFVLINLYDIATGPSHQDYMIRMKKGRLDPGRLSFDVKMSQIINIVIQAKSINCKMLSSLREKFYNFSLKMSAKDREIFSDHSENFKNMQMATTFADKNVEDVGHVEDLGDENYQLHMDENKKVKTKYFSGSNTQTNYKRMRFDRLDEREVDTLEGPKPDEESSLHKESILHMAKNKISSFTKTKTMNTLSHITAAKKDVVWIYPEDSANAPKIEMNVNVRELANASFQFFLWANKEGGANRSMSEDDESDYSGDELLIVNKLIAECFIAMNLFFARDAEIHAGNGTELHKSTSIPRFYQRRVVNIVEKLVYHGDHEGDLIGEFIVENSLFYKQMIFGVRTEEGIQRSSSLYLNADKTFIASLKNTNLKEIKTLSQHKDALKNISFNLYGPKINPRLKIRLIDELATNIIKVLDILKTSHQESVISVLYKTPENLLASQKILIGLAKHALENCDEVPNSLRPIYFETLLMLIRRAEFELNYMGFDEAYEEFLQNAQKASFKNDITGPKIDMKNIQQKLKVCESYQSFLYHSLQKVLTKLNQRGLPEKEREFVEQFTAIAYFRIPEFRKKLLECLKRDIEHFPLQEWRAAEWMPEDRIDANEKNQHFISLFDWEGDFYVYLKNTEKGESNYKLLNEILEDRDWQHRLSKRGVAFHSFLNEWAKHVNKTVVTKDHVPWQDLPGYSILIKSFLVELKAKDVKRYPQLLLNASYSLLKNEKLLNCFVAVVYNKTRIYESSNVFAVYELINNWFGVLKENKKSISPTFDYAYFFKGITMVIEGDHALTIAKALWVVYNNFNLFPYTQKERLSEYFFGDIFFKLFLHWSWNVRQVFHHLLIYRFYHQHRNTTTNLTNLDDLKKELLLYNQRRENFSKTKKVLINDFINMEYSQHMTIIENAYKKYREDKMQRAGRAKPQTLPRQATKQTRDTLRTSDLPEISEFNTASRQFPTLQELNSDRKDEEFPKLKLKGFGSEKQDMDSVVDDIFDMPEKISRKQSIPLAGEPSYWFINSDDVELSMQGPTTRRSRSGSLNITTTTPNKMLHRPEDLNMLDIEAAKKTTEAMDTLRVSLAATRKSLPEFGDEDKKREKKKVIVKRLMYFDKQTNKLKEIPKEYAVYLEYAYKEYEIIKEQYVKWANEFQQMIAKMPEEQVKKLKADPKVPELNVRIPLDEGEDGQMELDDW